MCKTSTRRSSFAWDIQPKIHCCATQSYSASPAVGIDDVAVSLSTLGSRWNSSAYCIPELFAVCLWWFAQSALGTASECLVECFGTLCFCSKLILTFLTFPKEHQRRLRWFPTGEYEFCSSHGAYLFELAGVRTSLVPSCPWSCIDPPASSSFVWSQIPSWSIPST